MSITALILGQTGQLSRALAVSKPDNVSIKSLGREDFDYTWEDTDILSALEPFKSVKVILNAAAYTAVDKAEEDRDTALRVNGIVPGLIAEFCHKHSIALIHISTDYVFDGRSKTAYKPNFPIAPLGVYGASKRAGEIAVQESGCISAILRTSWVYDGVGANFLTTMLRLGRSKEHINVVSDQIGRPTYAGHLAIACWEVAAMLVEDRKKSGIYHVSGNGEPISWADFAKAIFEKTKAFLPHQVTVKNILTSEYPTVASRPHFSVLDMSSFERTFDMTLPHWDVGLNRAIEEWQRKSGKEI